MLLGCIGDDFTGSGDLANTLTKQGMRTALYVGVPDISAEHDVEAGVVALKSRSLPSDLAVEQSLEALEWLKLQGCTQFLFKYCSTFDSTDEGNIGPVTEALAMALGATQIIVCPAFPATGRTVVHGHLFVNDKLLSESGMQNHPLTPMLDSDIRRVLARQSEGEVGHISYLTVSKGVASVKEQLRHESAQGRHLLVVDALSDNDLLTIAQAAIDLPLITGGSGIAMGLPENFRSRGLIGASNNPWVGESGRTAALCGSCSVMTQAQVHAHKEDFPSFEIQVEKLLDKSITAESVADWCLNQTDLPLVYSSADPEEVKRVQSAYGKAASAQVLESFFAELAIMLVNRGVTRLICAGGETSGSVIEGLALKELQIGPEIDPGVPAMRASNNLVLALKSGNFGAEDFFVKAENTLKVRS